MKFGDDTVLDDPAPRNQRRRIVAFWIILGAAILTIALFGRRQHRLSRPLDRQAISADVYYISIAPSSVSGSPASHPISTLRLHYTLHNNGSQPYRFPDAPSPRLMERVRASLVPASHDITLELPQAISATRDAEVVVGIPYGAEAVSREEWVALYPESDLPREVQPGRYSRQAVSVENARKLMLEKAVTPDSVLNRFEIVGEGGAREATSVGEAILRRKFPLLSGFAIVDDTNRTEIDLPLRGR